MTLYLYHGTTSKHLKGILENGILPTELTGNDSNWETTSASNRVYLTNTYPIHYALCSTSVEDDEVEDAIIFKVKVDKKDLLPDEDFLAQAYKVSDNLIEDTIFYRDHMHQCFDEDTIHELGQQSLDNMGTVCVPSVPANNIIEYTVLPHKDFTRLVMQYSDPAVSVIHYKIMGASYQKDLQEVIKNYGVTQVQQTNKTDNIFTSSG